MRALRLIDGTIIIPNFILETELNTMALEESEPLGHGHYQFSTDVRLEFTSLSDT